jgi:RHS repeat-associated protein
VLRAYRQVGDESDEDRLPDGIANTFKSIDYPLANDPPTYLHTYQAGVGRLTMMAGLTTSVKYRSDSSFSRYDRAGNRYWQDNRRPSNNASYDLTMTYFGADQKPQVVERITTGYEHQTDAGAWEEYRYDALGRRVLLRARRDSTKANCGPSNAWCAPVNRNSYIERTIWDGDQVLAEIRAPGGDQTSTTQLEADAVYVDTIGAPYGRTIYTNGASLDHPLDLIRVGYSFGFGGLPGFAGPVVVIPHDDWRGMAQLGTTVGGSDVGTVCQSNAQTGAHACLDNSVNVWPALATETDLRRSYGQPVPWYGNVIQQERDLSQNLYMRNRYYDPLTGKFTQEDPIGLACGLNLYGFANGDPVNYSDPFGLMLCPPFCPPVPVAGGAVGAGTVAVGAEGSAAGSVAVGAGEVGVGTVTVVVSVGLAVWDALPVDPVPASPTTAAPGSQPDATAIKAPAAPFLPAGLRRALCVIMVSCGIASSPTPLGGDNTLTGGGGRTIPAEQEQPASPEGQPEDTATQAPLPPVPPPPPPTPH